MNIIQVAEQLRELPLSTIGSEYIVKVLNMFDGEIDEDGKPLVTASSTGKEIISAFRKANPSKQAQLLEDVIDEKSRGEILNTILEQSRKDNEINTTTGFKWTSVTGSVLILSVGLLFYVVWSLVDNYGTKPPLDDAVFGNLITQLLKAGVEHLINNAGSAN